MDKAKDAMKPATKDMSSASAEDIMAEIDRTRARMDETLSVLGTRIKRRVPGKSLGIVLGTLIAGVLGVLAYSALKGRKTRHAALKSTWHKARVLEQTMLAARLAMAARKGKPAIIVVEPRKI